MKSTVRDAAVGLAVVAVLWELVARVAAWDFVPPPSRVLPIFLSPVGRDIAVHGAVTLARVLASLAVGSLIGFPIGLVLAQSHRLHRLFSPVVAALYPVPKIVFLPVAFVAVGINDVARIAIVAAILLFHIIVLVRDAGRALPEELLRSVRSLGAGRLALLRFVYAPAGFPALLSAVRVSIGTSLAVLFIAEQSLTRWGLGYFIVVESYQTLRYPRMYAGIIAMSVLGLVLHYSVSTVERSVGRVYG